LEASRVASTRLRSASLSRSRAPGRRPLLAAPPTHPNSNSSSSRSPRPTQQHSVGKRAARGRNSIGEASAWSPAPFTVELESEDRKNLRGEPHRRWPRRRRINQTAPAAAARRGRRNGGLPRHGESSFSASSASPPPLSRWAPLLVTL
jgi:hypothetical protein